MEEKKKCDHPACECRVPKNQKYCSDYCHDAKGTLELSCNCGHSGCAVSESAPTMAAQS